MQHYGARLATRLTRDVDRRLRLHAFLQRKPVCHVINELLDAALPSAADLRRNLGGSREGERSR